MKSDKKIEHFLRQIHTLILIRKAESGRRTRPRRQSDQPLQLVLLISRSHDIDLYLEIYRQALSIPEIKINFWATKRALNAFPATRKLLSIHKLKIDFRLEHKNLQEALKRLQKVDVLLNTVESSIAAHKIPYRLIKIANACGCLTFTLQHAFENIGLTCFDDNSAGNITFAAQWLLTWGEPANLAKKLAERTRRKCIAVGCPKRYLKSRSQAVTPPGEKPIISIFEGIHADRFDSAYRKNFFTDLQAITNEFNHFHFVLKLHPGVLQREPWQTDALAQLTNIDIIDPGNPHTRLPLSTPELLEKSLATITTPSTIALDAALTGTPAAVIRYQQKSPSYNLYQPLPLLDKTADWRDFLNQVRQNLPQLQKETENFLKQVMLPGNAAGRILNTILEKWHSTAPTNNL